ncbi:MAG TPA: PDR/VanB family oxidoreductase [Pseudonocardia sp.]|jgi:ferredoxin-NADP reductase|nr:PDR/VanB family oxidoreductase [Pseudonocardia sp.]
MIRGDTPLPDVPVHPGLRRFLTVMRGYRALVADSPLTPRLCNPAPVRRTGFDLDLRIDVITREAEDVVSLYLVAPDGAALPRWRPGAHVDVVLPSGRQRQYSLCGDPADPRGYRIAVRLIPDGDGGSQEIHQTLRAGQPLRVRGPRNAFRLVEATSYRFVAGGIGITPILPMVGAAAANGVPWRLDYLGRTRGSMPFLAELASLREGTVAIRPDDEFGPPDIARLLADVRPSNAVYVCGPPPMLDVARALFDPTGDLRELHTERFSPPPVVGGTPFEAELRRTGVTVEVGAEESVLAAVRREVPSVAYSCRQGFCGSCKTTVLAGRVEHRDSVLLDQERADSMLICVSRGHDRLVLDL